MLVPPKLNTGDKIAVVAPAKKIQTDLTAAFEILRTWGLFPVLGKHLYKTENYFSGTDSQRKEDLQWALDHPDIKAILIARGGYGTTRILDELNWDKFRENPKWICGFSDLTSLHIALNNMGIASIHGPMAVTLEWDNESTDALKNILFGTSIQYENQVHPFNHLGKAKAELIGGNLSIICNSIGTPSDIDTDGKILFLEEVGEYLYHLDRMMVHLKRAKKLNRLAGIIVGSFSSMKDHKDSFGAEAYEILSNHFQNLNIPIAFGFPLGHEEKNLPIICGVKAEFTVSEHSVKLTYQEMDS